MHVSKGWAHLWPTVRKQSQLPISMTVCQQPPFVGTDGLITTVACYTSSCAKWPMINSTLLTLLDFSCTSDTVFENVQILFHQCFLTAFIMTHLPSSVFLQFTLLFKKCRMSENVSQSYQDLIDSVNWHKASSCTVKKTFSFSQMTNEQV